jgi:hypothetical protein
LRSTAALGVTVPTFGSIVARLVVGQFIADKGDKRVITVVLFIGQAAAVLLYTMVGSTLAIYGVALLFGFTIGNVYMMMSLLTAELFGILSFGTVYGVVALAGQLGSGLGLVFMGWAHDATNGYTVPFVVLAALNLVAAVVITFARPVPSPTTIVPTAIEMEVRGRMTGRPRRRSSGHVHRQLGDDANEVAGGELGLTHHHVGNTSEQLPPTPAAATSPTRRRCRSAGRHRRSRRVGSSAVTDRSPEVGRTPSRRGSPSSRRGTPVALRDLPGLPARCRRARCVNCITGEPYRTNSSTAAMIRPSKSSNR